MCFRRKTSAGCAYLQIVESRRGGHQVRPCAHRLSDFTAPIQANSSVHVALHLGDRPELDPVIHQLCWYQL